MAIQSKKNVMIGIQRMEMDVIRIAKLSKDGLNMMFQDLDYQL